MTTFKMVIAGLLLAGLPGVGGLAGVSAAHAKPLSPGEIQFLEELHRAFSGSGDPSAFHSDGQLLAQGWYACHQLRVGLVGRGATYVPDIVTRLAFTHLCPNGAESTA